MYYQNNYNYFILYTLFHYPYCISFIYFCNPLIKYNFKLCKVKSEFYSLKNRREKNALGFEIDI